MLILAVVFAISKDYSIDKSGLHKNISTNDSSKQIIKLTQSSNTSDGSSINQQNVNGDNIVDQSTHIADENYFLPRRRNDLVIYNNKQKNLLIITPKKELYFKEFFIEVDYSIYQKVNFKMITPTFKNRGGSIEGFPDTINAKAFYINVWDDFRVDNSNPALIDYDTLPTQFYIGDLHHLKDRIKINL